MSLGIDYGHGLTNIDHATGIRYGVISQHSLASWFYDGFEAKYGDPTCPECNGPTVDPAEDDSEDTYTQYDGRGCADRVCPSCKLTIDSLDAYPEEPIGHELKDDQYHAIDCLDSDVMLVRSPFYTLAPFCSPCVPGAGNLDESEGSGAKTFCFGHDFFEDGKAPYRVFSVETGAEVFP